MRVTAERRLHAAVFTGSFDRFTIPPLLVPIHDALGVSLGAASAVASVYFIAYGASQPLWGGLSERFGRVRVLRGSIFGGGAACLVAALANDLGVLIAARGLAGFFFAAAMPAAMTYIGDTVPVARRQPTLAVLMANATAGVASGTIIAGITAEFVSWRLAFLISVALAAMASLLLFGLQEPRRVPSKEGFLRQVRTIAADRWVLVVLGLAFVEGAIIFGPLTFIAASLQDAGVGAALAGSAAAGFGLANSACTPIVTRAIARYPSPVLIAVGGVLTAGGLLLSAAESSVVTAMLTTGALGAGLGFMHSTFQFWATQVRPQARAVTVSFFASAVFSGGAFASAAAAPLVDAGRFSALFLIAAAAALVISAVGPLMRSRYLAGYGAAGADAEVAAATP